MPLSLLVDIGSSISLLKNSVIKPHTPLNKETLKLRGFNSTDDSVPTLGSVNLTIPLNNKVSIKHKFHVIENIDFPYGNVGNDILNEFKGSINFTQEVLKLDKYNIKLYFTDPYYIIPARTEKVIECSVSNSDLEEGLVLDQNPSEIF